MSSADCTVNSDKVNKSASIGVYESITTIPKNTNQNSMMSQSQNFDADDEENDDIRNFKLTTISFNQYTFVNVLLTPSSIENFRNVIFYKCGVKAFPILHTNRYRQASFVDINNLLGRGHNAIFSITGCDKSTLLLVANSLEEYLSTHYQTLVEDRYYMQNNEITAFRKLP